MSVYYGDPGDDSSIHSSLSSHSSKGCFSSGTVELHNSTSSSGSGGSAQGSSIKEYDPSFALETNRELTALKFSRM
jgi:hypothetical protein